MLIEPTHNKNLGDTVLQAMKQADVDLATYVADHFLSSVCEAMTAEPDFTLLPVAREDEGLGVLAGAYLGGRRGSMLMQSSGFALCANVLGSVLLPYQIPVVMIVGLRGDIGEFNVAQMSAGQAVGPICQALGIPYWVPDSVENLEQILPGVIDTAFSAMLPVCVGLRRTVVT